MIYAISALLFVLGLVTGLPAIPQLLRMRKIKQNSATATGAVLLGDHSHLNNGTMTGVMSSMLGKVSYVQISYETPDKKERAIEVIETVNFGIRRYKSGDSATVIYDKTIPSLAYVKKEWDKTLSDLWVAGGELLVAIILWNIGLALKLPI
jgi:hypothetical protein